jgi:hypothetical protein
MCPSQLCPTHLFCPQTHLKLLHLPSAPEAHLCGLPGPLVSLGLLGAPDRMERSEVLTSQALLSMPDTAENWAVQPSGYYLSYLFCSTGVWTQCLLLARGVLPLESLPQSFCLSHFPNRILHFSLGWPNSHVARMTYVYHHGQLIGWDGVLLTFYLGWPQNWYPPNFYFPSSWDYGCEPPNLSSSVLFSVDFIPSSPTKPKLQQEFELSLEMDDPRQKQEKLGY